MADSENNEETKESTQKEDKEEDTQERKKSARKSSKSKKEGSIIEQHLSDENVEEAAAVIEVLPENVFPLFLASKSQEIYGCKVDEDVTEENPFKFIPKADILEDMRNRAAVCDFHPFKQQINDYEGEDILIAYDPDFKHGQNFIIATTEEAKEALLKVLDEAEDEEGEGEEEEEDDTVYQYIPPEPKEWVSQGSEREILEANVVEARRKLKVSVKRLRQDFGAPVTFGNRNVGDAKDGAMDCPSIEDKNFEIVRLELDKGTQAINDQIDQGTQTTWKYPRNANVQTYPREFTETEQEQFVSSEGCKKFVENAANDFHKSLQQNEIMNVFYVDWIHLGDGDDLFGSKADNHLKEYQSFTDLQFSKDKVITCIQWHPTIKGVVATSVAEKLSYDERIDQAAKVIMTPSLILIWSFADPIHPQLILEAPDDIYSFAFNHSDANIIAGGCYNGQVVLWDISAHADRLKQQRGTKNKKRTVLPGFEDPNALKTPIVRYCGVSSIENSHKGPVTDIQWLPDHIQLNKMGVPQENTTRNCTQLMSCATDNCVLVWDTKPPKILQLHDDKGPKQPMGVPDTFKYLDLTWKPHLKVYLAKSEPGGDHAPTKFSIQERQGDKSSLGSGADIKEGDAGGMQGGFNKPSSGKERTLQSVKTYVYVGTEDGEVVYVDWMPQKDQDSGKIQTPKPAYYHSLHDGPVVSLNRSPFFKDVLLSVGGWTLALWKEGVSSGPILVSASSSVKMSCGIWSPTRPGVFFIAKVDGCIDVWDLLDRTHEPTLTQSVSPTAITNIYPFQVTQKQQLIAVGDMAGTLHILEIPWSLRQASATEVNGVSNYIEREVKRRAFVEERWNFREKEKRELEAESKRKAGGLVAALAAPTEEELEFRAKQEYQTYLDAESAFLRELGIVEEEHD